MSQSLLVLIASDPETDHRPAEALRIAAGIAAWERVRVSVYLHGPAVKSLSADAAWLEDGECIVQALDLLRKHGLVVGAEPNDLLNAVDGARREADGPALATRVDEPTLNRWISSHDTVLRF